MSELIADGAPPSRDGFSTRVTGGMTQYARDLLGALWENKTELPYAWKILKHGLCDGCSLGVCGLYDALEGVHLCLPRLKPLKVYTSGALDTSVMGEVSPLQNLDLEDLHSLGRLAYPMLRRQRQAGFSRVSWEEAFRWVVKTIRDTAPHQMGFFAASHGLTNEVYYVLQKLARVLGTNNLDLCSPGFHAASVAGLKATLGIGVSSCSLSDVIGTDLVVVVGAGERALAKYLCHAKKQRARVVVLGADAALENWRVPPLIGGAFFADNAVDEIFPAPAGGEIAFINGALKALIEWNQLNEEFIDKHTHGFAELRAALQEQSWEMLEQRSGATRIDMERFARLYGSVKNAVFAYGAELAQGASGPETIKALVNLALARGMIGRERCGILALRGASGVQGGEDCGFQPDNFPGDFPVDDENARRFSNLWRHPAPSNPGLDARGMMEAARRHDLKFFYSVGGNLPDATADRHRLAAALRKVKVRVHQDIALDASMLIEAEEAVLLLPGQTLYEQRGGGTSTSSERRIRFTPEIPRRRVGESRPHWEIPALIGRQSMPNGDFLFPFHSARSIREEMSRVMPIYKGIERLSKEGDQLQWGGAYLYRDGFSGLPGGRALFTVLDPPEVTQSDITEERLPHPPPADPSATAVSSETEPAVEQEAYPLVRLVDVRARKGYRLWLRFADGTEGEVDLAHLAGRGPFASWRDRRFFTKVRIELGRALVWGNGSELCVDSLYLRLTGKTAEEIFPASEAPDLHA